MRYICLYVFFFILLSCNKNKGVDIESGKYIPEQYGQIESAVLYTKGFSTSNIDFISGYLRRKGQADHFILDRTSVPVQIDPDFYIRFFPDDKVETGAFPGFLKAEIVLKSKSHYVVASVDSIPYLPFFNDNSQCRKVAERVLKVKPALACANNYPLPGPGGFPIGSTCKFRQMFSLIFKGNNVYLPFMTYSISSSASGSVFCNYYEGNLINTFDEEVLNILGTTDTLVVQTSLLKLTRSE